MICKLFASDSQTVSTIYNCTRNCAYREEAEERKVKFPLEWDLEPDQRILCLHWQIVMTFIRCSHQRNHAKRQMPNCSETVNKLIVPIICCTSQTRTHSHIRIKRANRMGVKAPRTKNRESAVRKPQTKLSLPHILNRISIRCHSQCPLVVMWCSQLNHRYC